MGPDTPKAVGRAFDEVWNEMASHRSLAVDARYTLLSIADDASRDVEMLKRSALQMMTPELKHLADRGENPVGTIRP